MIKDKALRLALEALGNSWTEPNNEQYEIEKNAITAIKAALEAKDETSMKVEGPLHVICQCDKCKPQIAFNAEVVGYVAPQRTWVGLTMDELATLVVKTVGYPIKLAESIEAKIKEKNT